MQLKYPEQRGMGGQVEMRNNIKIRKSNDQNISGAYTIFTEVLNKPGLNLKNPPRSPFAKG
jgi:hypothetical protein